MPDGQANYEVPLHAFRPVPAHKLAGPDEIVCKVCGTGKDSRYHRGSGIVAGRVVPAAAIAPPVDDPMMVLRREEEARRRAEGEADRLRAELEELRASKDAEKNEDK